MTDLGNQNCVHQIVKTLSQVVWSYLILSRTKSTTNSFCCNLTEAKAKWTISIKYLYKQLRKTMMRDQPRWSFYLHLLLGLDVELFVKALVTTWETIPTGQKRRQSETECLVSILFSNPSLKTCLHRNKQNLCHKKHVLDFWLNPNPENCNIPSSKKINNKKMNPSRSKSHFTWEHFRYSRQLQMTKKKREENI